MTRCRATLVARSVGRVRSCRLTSLSSSRPVISSGTVRSPPSRDWLRRSGRRDALASCSGRRPAGAGSARSGLREGERREVDPKADASRGRDGRPCARDRASRSLLGEPPAPGVGGSAWREGAGSCLGPACSPAAGARPPTGAGSPAAGACPPPTSASHSRAAGACPTAAGACPAAAGSRSSAAGISSRAGRCRLGPGRRHPAGALVLW